MIPELHGLRAESTTFIQAQRGHIAPLGNYLDLLRSLAGEPGEGRLDECAPRAAPPVMAVNSHQPDRTMRAHFGQVTGEKAHHSGGSLQDQHQIGVALHIIADPGLVQVPAGLAREAKIGVETGGPQVFAGQVFPGLAASVRCNVRRMSTNLKPACSASR